MTYGILYIDNKNILQMQHIQAPSLEAAQQEANKIDCKEIIAVEEV